MSSGGNRGPLLRSLPFFPLPLPLGLDLLEARGGVCDLDLARPAFLWVAAG